MLRLFLMVAAFAPAAHSQTLSVLVPDSTGPGAKTTVEVLLKSTGREPLIVQWDFVFPPNLLQLEPSYPKVAPSAYKAGKTIACTGKWLKAPVSYVQTCMVAGGNLPVPDGSVAVYRFTTAKTNKRVQAPLQLDKVQLLMPDLKRVDLKKTDASLAIVP